MRVTAETKAATRQRILEAARQLFATGGFDTSTTRDIADAAGIATGTLFNYFPTKEAADLASLAAEAIAGVDRDFEERAGECLEEELFAFVAAGLRKLKPLRKHLPALLETGAEPPGRYARRGGPVAPPFAFGDGRAAVQEAARSRKGAVACRITALLDALTPEGALMFWDAGPFAQAGRHAGAFGSIVGDVRRLAAT